MQKAVAEIAEKKRNQLPLTPDVKFVQAEQPAAPSGEEMR
jgi:hypothetical protein